MMPGLATLLGWTSCFAAAMLVALSKRPGPRTRAVAILVGSVAVAVLLASVGTVLLAAAALAWGAHVAWQLGRELEQASSCEARDGVVSSTTAPVATRRVDAWGTRLALVIGWLLLGVVGVGTVVRLYVTFGADLSLHPTHGEREIVLRGVFVEHPMLVALIVLALLLRTMIVRDASAWSPSAASNTPGPSTEARRDP